MTANLSFETCIAPKFHARKPKPVENSPRNNNAYKLDALSIAKFVELIIENIEVINTAPKTSEKNYKLYPLRYF